MLNNKLELFFNFMHNKFLIILIFFNCSVFSASRVHSEQKKVHELELQLLNLRRSVNNQQANPALKCLILEIKKFLNQYENKNASENQILKEIIDNIIANYNNYPGLPEVLSNEENLNKFLRILVKESQASKKFLDQKLSNTDNGKKHIPKELPDVIRSFLYESNELGFCKDLIELLTLTIKVCCICDSKTNIHGNVAFAFSYDDRYMAISSWCNKKITIYDLEDAKVLFTFNKLAGDIKFSPTKNQLAMQRIRDSKLVLEVFDIPNNKIRKIFEYGYLLSFCFSADGKKIAVNPNKKITVIDLETLEHKTFTYEYIEKFTNNLDESHLALKRIIKCKFKGQFAIDEILLREIYNPQKKEVARLYYEFDKNVTELLDFDILDLSYPRFVTYDETPDAFLITNNDKYVILRKNHLGNKEILSYKLDENFIYDEQPVVAVKQEFNERLSYFSFSPNEYFFGYTPSNNQGVAKIVILNNYLKRLNFEQIKLLIELAKINKCSKYPVVKLNEYDQRVFDSFPPLIKTTLKQRLKFDSVTNRLKRFVKLKILNPIAKSFVSNLSKAKMK